MMRAGKLRHPITIEQPTDTQGSTYGQAGLTWTTFKRTRASIEPASGKEQIGADQVQAGVTHVVGMRFIPGVTTKMRIAFGTRVFSIISTLNIQERNRELKLMCMEEV